MLLDSPCGHCVYRLAKSIFGLVELIRKVYFLLHCLVALEKFSNLLPIGTLYV